MLKKNVSNKLLSMHRRIIEYLKINEQWKWYKTNTSGSIIFHNIQRYHYSSKLRGKYNKREKKSSLLITNNKSVCPPWKVKYNFEKKINNRDSLSTRHCNKLKEENSLFLNKIFSQDESSEGKKSDEFVEITNISNAYIRHILHENGIHCLYKYQYTLVELLKYQNVLFSCLYSDSLLSYLVYALYKVYASRWEAVQTKKEKKIESEKGACQKIVKNVNGYSVLFVVASDKLMWWLHETLTKFKNPECFIHVIANEKNVGGIGSSFFLYPFVIWNIQKIEDDFNCSVLVDQMDFVIIDDVNEIYKNKKSTVLKNILSFCQKKQMEKKDMKVLVINKTCEVWVFNEILHYLKSLHYHIIQDNHILTTSHGVTNSRWKSSDHLEYHCVDMRKYKKSVCKQSSVQVSLNEDKKRLVLMYILQNIGQNKKVVILHEKDDIYNFYKYLNSYFPCIFLPANQNQKSINHQLCLYNEGRHNYILITNDPNVKKYSNTQIDIFILYTFVKSIHSYADVISTYEGTTDTSYEVERLKNPQQIESKGTKEEVLVEFILFYNRKELRTYQIMNNIFHFNEVSLPNMKIMKEAFIKLLIKEIEEVVIDDIKHMDEANRIREQFGATFLSAALYYIQKKKLFQKSGKKAAYKNVTFLVERNRQINCRKNLLDLLNNLLNYKKDIGDITLFVHNYFYSKKGYILTAPEDIYITLQKNKNSKENKDLYGNISMYLLYNQYEKKIASSCGYAKKGVYQSKKSQKRLRKKLSRQKEQLEINKLKKRISSIFKMNRRNVQKTDSLTKKKASDITK